MPEAVPSDELLTDQRIQRQGGPATFGSSTAGTPPGSADPSKSPSSDIVKPPKKKADRRKRVKRGGQKGHPRILRESLPPERIDEQITCEIGDSDVDRLKLTPTEGFQTFQYIELLDMPIYVTEYRLREYLDSDGNIFLPDVPDLNGRPVCPASIFVIAQDLDPHYGQMAGRIPNTQEDQTGDLSNSAEVKKAPWFLAGH